MTANEFVEDFPQASALRRIGAVNRVINAGAKYVLVHCTIKHFPTPGCEVGNLDALELCQTEWLEGGLPSLMEHPLTRMEDTGTPFDLHTEGWFAPNRYRIYSKPLPVNKLIESHPAPQVQVADATASPVVISTDETREKYSTLIGEGADNVLAEQKKVMLHGIEWPDLHQLAVCATCEDWEDQDRYIFDKRELATLEILVAQHREYARLFAEGKRTRPPRLYKPTYYGVGHDWRKMTALHNSDHEDDKFSLVELFTDSLSDYAERPNRHRRHTGLPHQWSPGPRSRRLAA